MTNVQQYLAPPLPQRHSGAVQPRVLAVGLDPRACQVLVRWAAEESIELEAAPDLPRAIRRLAADPWDVVLAVLESRPEEEIAWWAETLAGCAGAPRLVAVARRPSMQLVIRAEQHGALDVLRLPLQRDAVLRAVRRVSTVTTEARVPLPDVAADPVGNYHLVGQSPAMLEVYKMIARVASSTATVLIEGESGTGKEVVARAIHAHGPRAERPFVAVNCAAIPETLLESELFGHERGAFTGAVTTRIGRFEQATGGTLFLDEVGDMSLALQAKILRAIQEREVERLGGRDVVTVDVRLIAATNRDLKAAVSDKRFREDLYYRLAVVQLRLPTLVDRGDDLLLLTAHFAREFGRRYSRPLSAISDRALELLRAHTWVGNVRELRNVIERAVLVADGDTLRSEHLPDELRSPSAPVPGATPHEPLSLRDAEARHIARVLAQADGQVGTAAELLGIHRNTLARKMRDYGLR